VLGVADSGRVLGTELDAEWLRHRIFERVDVAPAIDERRVCGERVLVLYVAEAREPVEDPDRKVRWRVGDHCVPIDRSEWWLRRQERSGLDVMAAVTEREITEVAPGALVVARRYLRSSGDVDTAACSDPELLRRLGVLRPDGALTQAGVLVFCAAPTTLITLVRFDVPGGEILNPPRDLSGLALLEQLEIIELSLSAFNTATTVISGFAEAPVLQIPERTVREALLNGLIHRDWMSPEPVAVTWFDFDHVLEVTSPGGFTGGMNQDNVLSKRFARYPALSDLFRALRLVEKQGVGVDRMYREMISFGHRPPRITEQVGPQVRTKLVGGPPVLPVMSLVQSVEPLARRRDTRISVILYNLLQTPFLTTDGAARVLQTDAADAQEALDIACMATVDAEPLVGRFKDVVMLSAGVLRRLERDEPALAGLRRRGMLTYRRPDAEGGRAVVEAWLAVHDRITSGDYAMLTGLTSAGAKRALDRLVPDVLTRGAPTGRSAHYIAVANRSDE
jgi:ATP-dependent DNA helicase RecG